MTRLELRTLIRKELGETTAAFWTDTELNTWINLACNDIAFRTKCLKATSPKTVTTTESVADYTISTSIDSKFLEPYRVSYQMDGDNWVKIPQTNMEELDLLFEGWENTDDGTPFKYYYDVDRDSFSLYPAPDEDNAGAYLKIYYYIDHTDLVLDSESPTIPKPLHLAIADFVTAVGFRTRGWGDKENDSWAKYFQRLRDYKVTNRDREDFDIVSKVERNI